MPDYYKLFYSSSVEIPLTFYDNFKVLSKLEFPLYQEILIKRPDSYSKSFLKFKLLSLDLPLPLIITCPYNRKFTFSPLHYSTFELNKLKMYNLIK